ncbi:hypothetical protein BHE74_00036318 [Ensete ventricosum]|nr:hypothetical protein BHE74_00036318 [Ensete ventricosum]
MAVDFDSDISLTEKETIGYSKKGKLLATGVSATKEGMVAVEATMRQREEKAEKAEAAAEEGLAWMKKECASQGGGRQQWRKRAAVKKTGWKRLRQRVAAVVGEEKRAGT